jgi:hypothetical protein
MEEKGFLEPGFWSTLPRDESEISATLEKVEKRKSELGNWDRLRLRRFREEFPAHPQDPVSRLHYRDSAFLLRGGLEYFTGGYFRDSLPKAEGYAFGSFTPKVEAAYGERLYLVSSATVGMERNRLHRFLENYDPQRGLPYNTSREGKRGIPQTVSTLDGFRTVAGIGNSRLRLEAGQDWNQWGPGQWQHAALGAHPHFWASDSLPPDDTTGFRGSAALFPGGFRRGYRYPGEGPPLPQVRLRVGSGRWEYVKVVAQRTGLWADSSAYLIAHRLQVRLGRNWRLGFFELMAVGNRSPDWAALLPAVPLKFAEHAGGDRDNIALGLDAEWLWKSGRLYAEFYADDYSGPPFDYWGNKFAFTLGGTWQDPFSLPSEFGIEFAQTDPWVYGHHRRNGQMQSHGALLGSVLPPNARALFSSLEFPLPQGAQARVEWRWRQRDLGSPGSSIFDAHDPADGDKKAFLESRVENRNEVSGALEWRWKRFVQLRGGLGGLWVDGWRGEEAMSLATPSVFGEVWLRY